MSRRPDWDAARKRDYAKEHGVDPVDPERPNEPLLVKARRGGSCYDCKHPIRKGQRVALRHPGVLCKQCAGKAFKDGRI